MPRIKRPKKITKEISFFRSSQGDLEFLLKRSSHRRTLTISIDEKANLSVSVPFSSKMKEIQMFMKEKEHWIITRVKQAKDIQSQLQSRDFIDGNNFLFMGEKCTLNVRSSSAKRAKIEFDGQRWLVSVPESLSEEKIKQLTKAKMIQWYRQQAQEVLGGRLFYYARIINVTPKTIAIRAHKRIWGNCDYNTQTIHLNWQIILAPMEVIDYVVVHELCHLIVPNHSKRFWNQVKKFYPQYLDAKAWLKKHHYDMVLP